MMSKIRFLFFLGLLPALAYPQLPGFALYEKKIFSREGVDLPYRLLYPPNYDPKKQYPLIVFLHGSGQLGRDNERQLLHGGLFFLKDSLRRSFPAIVVFPQCGPSSAWSGFKIHFDTVAHRMDLSFPFQEQPAKYALVVKELADSLSASGAVDTTRRYIGGLSLGAFGTFDFIERYPGYFAAAFPICGGGDTTYAPKIAGATAVWLFHGDADPVVPVGNSRSFYRALKKAGADVRYTEYPGVKHNSWDNAFREPGLMEWIFAKTTAAGKPFSTAIP